MTNIMKLAVIVSLILHCGVSSAGDRDNDQLAQTLMHKSGLKKQIEQIPQLLQAEMDRHQAEAQGLPREEFNEIIGLTRSAFDAKTIHAAVQTYIQSNLSGNDMKEVLDWLESPLGKKITKLEEDASTVEAYAEMQAKGQKLLDENKDSARLMKIKMLDNAIGATESSVNTLLNIQLAMLTAMSAAVEADRRPSYEDVQELVNNNKSRVQAAIHPMVQIQFLYTYRELTDFEMDRYTRFAESKSGRRYHSVTIKAMDDALVQAARKIGSRMGMRMNRTRESREGDHLRDS